MERTHLKGMTLIFFALYLVLPEYFGIEISSSLPLITASRLILIFYALSVLFSNRMVVKVSIAKDSCVKNRLFVYFACIIFVNVCYVTTTSSAINQLFTTIVEELLVVYLIVETIDTEDKIVSALEIMMKASGVIAVISIISSLAGTNLFYLLKTVDREMLMSGYSRLGILRAEAGFGHAVYYGLYCTVMIPICMYFIEQKKNTGAILPSVCLFLNIIALLFSNSRGTMVAMIVVWIYMLITSGGINFLLKYKTQIICILLALLLCLLIPNVREFLFEVGNSMLAILFPEETTLSSNYGTNSDGLLSRLVQLSVVSWTLQNHPLIGMGADAQTRGVVRYLNENGKWALSNTYDVGYVGIFSDYGIIGSIGYIALYSIVFRYAFGKQSTKGGSSLTKLFQYMFLSYFVCMLSVAGLHNLFWVMIGLLIAYINCNYNDDYEIS